jgi:hypothetical protein
MSDVAESEDTIKITVIIMGFYLSCPVFTEAKKNC